MRFVLASGNKHKAQEFESILRLAGCASELLCIEAKDTAECGVTYYQNAYRKADAGLAVWHQTYVSQEDIVVADDSGLELPEFGGIPGVYSARFTYGGMPGRSGLALFLHDHGVTTTPANFVCWIIAFVPWTNTCVTARGIVCGTVSWSPRGSGGFGYDPLFIPTGHVVTFGEMDPKLKDSISHRAVAIQELWSSIEARMRL